MEFIEVVSVSLSLMKMTRTNMLRKVPSNPVREWRGQYLERKCLFPSDNSSAESEVSVWLDCNPTVDTLK